MTNLGITCSEENVTNCGWATISKLYYKTTLASSALLAFLLLTQ